MKQINTKEALISHFAFEMLCQSKNYYDMFWTWSNRPFMENYINNYYPNFKDVLKDVKIYLDTILKQTRFFLEYARSNIIHYSLKIPENERKNIFNVITCAYKKWIDTLLNDGLNMKRNTMYIDGFNKYINNQDILTVIDKDKDLKEVLEALSFSATIINSDINVVISKIEILNKYLKCQSDNEFEKKLVTDVHAEFFTALRNSIDKSDVDTMFDLKEKTNNAEDIYEIVKSYEKQQDNSIDNE